MGLSGLRPWRPRSEVLVPKYWAVRFQLVPKATKRLFIPRLGKEARARRMQDFSEALHAGF